MSVIQKSRKLIMMNSLVANYVINKGVCVCECTIAVETLSNGPGSEITWRKVAKLGFLIENGGSFFCLQRQKNCKWVNFPFPHVLLGAYDWRKEIPKKSDRHRLGRNIVKLLSQLSWPLAAMSAIEIKLQPPLLLRSITDESQRTDAFGRPKHEYNYQIDQFKKFRSLTTCKTSEIESMSISIRTAALHHHNKPFEPRPPESSRGAVKDEVKLQQFKAQPIRNEPEWTLSAKRQPQTTGQKSHSIAINFADKAWII